MAQLTFAIDEDIVRRALDSSEPSVHHVGESGSGGLYAADTNLFDAATTEAWAKLRALVEKCTRQGTDFVKEEVVAFVEFVEETGQALGARAGQLREWILTKIRELITKTFDLLLAALRTEITIGSRRYVLESVELEQKLIYSGSLQASLTELCEFTGGGELTLTGSYKANG